MNEYGIFPNLFLHIFDVRNQSIQKKNKATSRLMFLIMALYTRENKPRLIFSRSAKFVIFICEEYEEKEQIRQR